MELYDYSKEYAEAFKRTASFGLDVLEQAYQSGKLFAANQDSRLSSVLSSLFRNVEIKDVSAQCFAINHTIRPHIDAAYGTKSALTFGWVHDPQCDFFRLPEQELELIIANGISGPILDLHCWLTLPTHEILDCTLATTKAVADKKPESIGLILAKHWISFANGRRYHPMVVGEALLRRAGTLVDVSTPI